MVYGTAGAVPLAGAGAAAKGLTDSAPWSKANFNPDQSRVPAGNPDGGQWTSEGDGADSPSADAEAGPDIPVHLAQAQTCQEFIAENCRASILREFPGQFLHVPIDRVLGAAKSGDPAARQAEKLLLQSRFRK